MIFQIKLRYSNLHKANTMVTYLYQILVNLLCAKKKKVSGKNRVSCKKKSTEFKKPEEVDHVIIKKL